MLWAALVITASLTAYLLARYLRAEKVARFAAYGWVGLGIIAVAEALLFAEIRLVGFYFTPLVWTGYILAADAAVFSVRGRSLIRSEPDAFLWMAVLSVFLWLIFEGYNRELLNWTYVGLPRGLVARYLGYGWSFATIWPAVLKTADLLMALGRAKAGATPSPPAPLKASVPWIVVGAAMLIAPLLAPWPTKVYMFGLVWLGLIFLADSLNYRAARPSILGDLAVGYRARLRALLEAGLLCGFLWEFWNYWARAKWLYIFPILENYTLFEMPVVGYPGFLLFAVEIFAMYTLATALLNLPRYDIGADSANP